MEGIYSYAADGDAEEENLAKERWGTRIELWRSPMLSEIEKKRSER